MAARHQHVSNNEQCRLPPLRSLNFPCRPPDAHNTQDQLAYDLPQDVNAHTTTANPASFAPFAYQTPTPTSTTTASAPAYVHRQLPFQGQSPSQSHDHDASTWQQQQHQHGLARTTPLVPTTVDTPAAPPARNPTAFPSHPRHRQSFPPPSPYTPNASHPYPPSYHPSSTPAPAPFYNASPAYSSTSPTFAPSTSPHFPSSSATAPYPSHNAYPTPTSAYPHPPPSPTPTPTQTPAHFSAAYQFEDTRPAPTYENPSSVQPVRAHPPSQHTRDARVPNSDRARHPHSQPKIADATRIDSRHDMYPHPASVPPSAPVDARHNQSYSQYEQRPTDSSRPGTSYAPAQPTAHVTPQPQSEVARPYPPEQRSAAYTQDTKYTYPQSHASEPSARAGAGYTQNSPTTRVGYRVDGQTAPQHVHNSRTGLPHAQKSHENNGPPATPYAQETRQPSGYAPNQDTRHGYASSDAPTVPSSCVPTEQRHPIAPPPYVPSNADQRSTFGDPRTHPSHAEPPRSGYSMPDPVQVPAVVSLPRPPPPPPHIARQNGQPQPQGYSTSLSPYPPQHTAPSYSRSPASAPGTAPQHPQSQSYNQQSQLSQPSHGHPPAQATTHPTQTPAQPSHALPHAQAQQMIHHPEVPRPAFVSPADTMHARDTRFTLSTIAEEDREREREKEREREHEREKERERERELERERERERREREQREREKERERLAELKEKDQRERARNRERESIMHQVLEHCTVLYNFASRYAQPQTTTSVTPPPEELAEMAHRAQEVVRLLESLRTPSSGKLANTSTAPTSLSASAAHPSSTFGDRSNSHAALSASGSSTDLDTRAPKRPWEETQASNTLPHVSQLQLSNSPAGAGSGGQTAAERSAAEKDMEIIRTKRALTTSLAAAAAAAGGTGPVAGAIGGAVSAGKSKYRKRSRATPPGKCHSCNIRETPEWRRGPDGARTLCNACGLHYAKLVRKRDKAHAAEGGNGAMVRIDMDMLRASARAAESEKASRAAANGTNAGGSTGSGSNGNGDMEKMSVHTGTFQIVPMNMAIDNESGSGQGPSSKTQAHQQPPPPPPTQPSTAPTNASGTPHLHSHGIGTGQGHSLPPPQANAHYASNQPRTHGGPPPPPWVGKTYGQEMQHPLQSQSFMRTSHSVSSGASPPR